MRPMATTRRDVRPTPPRVEIEGVPRFHPGDWWDGFRAVIIGIDQLIRRL
jgi:hypothetical protein